MDSKPTRGTRLPLGTIPQNIQPEKKATLFKPTQRPLSVPNLKSLFHGSTKPVNDENRDIEKAVLSEYLPAVHVPPLRKNLPKRNTTIFRDPGLKTVNEVDDSLVTSNTSAEPIRSTARDITVTQPEPVISSAPSIQCESNTEFTKTTTLVQQDAEQINTIADNSNQQDGASNIASIVEAPPALPQTSEPVAQTILEAVTAAENYLNPPAPPIPGEPVELNTSASPDLTKSLMVKKVKGPNTRRSNPNLPMTVMDRQVTAIYHGVPEQGAKQNVSAAAILALSEDRIVPAYLHDMPQPSNNASEAVTAAKAHDSSSEDKMSINVAVPAIPMAVKDRQVAAIYSSTGTISATSLVEGNENARAMNAAVGNFDDVRRISLDQGPPLLDPNRPKGLRSAVVNSIKANALAQHKPAEAPNDTQKVSVKKRRDVTLRAADYPQPLPWVPALQPPGLHQHVDSCAAVGILGPKAVETRYLTPIYTVLPEPQGTDPNKDEEAYDSYDEDDGYVTAPSWRSNGETTTDGATTDLYPRWNQKARREIAEATGLVESTRTQEDVDDEAMDPTMVAEYADEIFAHLRETEVKMLPNPFYMEEQNELQWSMRSVLMDWLVQVHSRCNLLPETLFITANFVDRFLSGKIVSLGKLQLVGATALFLAAKKEEINCPTLSEIVYMVDNTYTSDELIKAERYMLNILKWELEWPGPMSFLRRISKADDYDLETRTLAKYFLEVTLMEERFIGTPCSFAAAASHCLARLMLGKGQWTPHHVYYSNYTYAQLHPLLRMLLYCVENPLKHHAAVFEKYADRRYKRASTYVEVELQRGFVLPSLPTSLNRNTVDEIVAPYSMMPFYNSSFNYHVGPTLSSTRVFST